MSIFQLLGLRRTPSADAAKERLQIVLAHERFDRSRPDFLPLLQKEILQVIQKHISVDSSKIEVKLERGADISTLEVNVELPAIAAVKAGIRSLPLRAGA